MGDPSKRLESLGPKIQAIMKYAGTAGLSLELLHRGEPVHYADYGYRDVQSNSASTKETSIPWAP